MISSSESHERKGSEQQKENRKETLKEAEELKKAAPDNGRHETRPSPSPDGIAHLINEWRGEKTDAGAAAGAI